jgi:hypothetical protein
MKLAIYGDSFADPLSGPQHLHASAWSRQLEQHHLVRNYAISGSSLYHMMSEFENSYSWADRVIFIVTGYGRWPGSLRHDGRLITLPSVDQCRYQLSLNTYPREVRSKIESVRDWFIGAQVDSFERYLHELMIERIYTLRPDALVMNIWPWGSDRQARTSFCMSYVRRTWANWLNPNLSWDEFNLEWNRWQETNCVCHMPPEANSKFLEDVLVAVDQGHWMPPNHERIILAGSQTDYYKAR